MNAARRPGSGAPRWPVRRALLLLAVLAPAASYAASRRVILDQTYIEPTPVVSVLAKGASPCRVHIVEIADARRSPEMIGMLGGKPVLAPQDRTAWLLSVVSGLKARGIDLDFNNPSVETPGIINANISLQTAWVNAVQVSFDNSVVFKVQAKGTDTRTVDQYYRGSSSRMNWASGDGETKSGINIAFSRALDAIARDLARLCDAKKI
jgi:hypothetical protein